MFLNVFFLAARFAALRARPMAALPGYASLPKRVRLYVLPAQAGRAAVTFASSETLASMREDTSSSCPTSGVRGVRVGG